MMIKRVDIGELFKSTRYFVAIYSVTINLYSRDRNRWRTEERQKTAEENFVKGGKMIGSICYG